MTQYDPALVSCVIPVYNGARFVAESIESVLAQAYRPLEVIVVDDGSTDGTEDVLAAFGDRIRVFFQPNAGAAAARNRGVAEARGGWLTFQDADDLWAPDKLERQMECFRRNPELDLCFGYLQNFWEPELREIEERARETWLAQPHPAHGPPLMLMRASLLARRIYVNAGSVARC